MHVICCRLAHKSSRLPSITAIYGGFFLCFSRTEPYQVRTPCGTPGKSLPSACAALQIEPGQVPRYSHGPTTASRQLSIAHASLVPFSPTSRTIRRRALAANLTARHPNSN